MQDKMWDDFSTLPLEAQRQAADFIAFLRQRYHKPTAGTEAKKTNLSAEPFIGMWQDRTEMQDSTAWVRDLRKREWTR
jgi:hypothetical protein